MQNFIQEEIQKLFLLMMHVQQDDVLILNVEKIVNHCVFALKAGKKILFAGNGGSAADAQHLAAELVGKLNHHRPGLAAIALTTDISALTAIGNDYAFDQIFSRQIEALGQVGDVFVGISTSGKSPNIIRALEIAKMKGMVTIGFTGKKAPLMDERCDLVMNIPSSNTSNI